MAKYVPLSEAELNNDSSIFSSVAAGFASGLLKTVEGVVSLGAELIDLGADSNTAASVEQFFDDVNIFEDTAQDRVAGKLVEVFTQIGIPGTAGFKAATKLADKAIEAKKAGNYVNSRSKALQDGMKQAQSLNERVPNKAKRFVAGVYKEEGLMQDLFPMTRSCVGGGNETRDFTAWCWKCFWCYEKAWAFNLPRTHNA